MEPIPQTGSRELLSQLLAALVGLDNHVYPLDSFQVFCKLRLPGARPWYAESGYPVIPESLGVALTFDQDRVTGLPDALQAPQAVQTSLAAGAPPESVVGLLR